jgi:hypothetical protein
MTILLQASLSYVKTAPKIVCGGNGSKGQIRRVGDDTCLMGGIFVVANGSPVII